MASIKNEILKKICYTELVYGRINKKLGLQMSKNQIEDFILKVLAETNENHFINIGKNYYVTSKEHNVRITINLNTFRIITVDSIDR